MEFKRFPKITNTYDSKHVTSVKIAMYDQKIQDEWVIKEKIHGSNFACYMNDDEIRFASRNNFLSDDETNSFFNFRSIRNKVEDDMVLLYNYLMIGAPEADYIVVYFELFGGNYIHPDVPKNNQSKVQKGVSYCPDLNIKVLDIRFVIGEDSVFVTPKYIESSCVKFNIDCAKIKFKGTLDECLAYPNDEQSEIYKEYNLPVLEDNVCEGVVISPSMPFYDNRQNRAIFKNKNTKFSEKAGEKKRAIKIPKELTDEDRQQIELVDAYVTMNRLNNIESKLGTLEEPKQIGSFIKAMMLDVIEDVKYEEDIELDKPARVFVSKQVKALIMERLYNV